VTEQGLQLADGKPLIDSDRRVGRAQGVKRQLGQPRPPARGRVFSAR
jgi:hypothetical protein